MVDKETLAKRRALLNELAKCAAQQDGYAASLCAQAAGLIAQHQAEIQDMGAMHEMLVYIKKYVLKSIDGQAAA